MGNNWFARFWRKQGAPEAIVSVPGDVEMRERVTEELLPLPLESIPLPLDELMQHVVFKDLFQVYFEDTYTKLYLLMRDSAAYMQQIEGRIPLIILDEKRILQLIGLLQKALRLMKQEQSKENQPIGEVCPDLNTLPPFVWPPMSPTPTPSVTQRSTPTETDLSPGYCLDGEGENWPYYADEEYEEEEEGEDEETDDGHGYSSSS